jgi:hypothetical protein
MRLGAGGQAVPGEGLSARMSADEQAESNIEPAEICAGLGPILDGLNVPIRFPVGTGASMGGSAEEMERMRATLDPVVARNPHIKSAKVASNHTKALRDDFRAVADAVRELARGQAAG